MTLKIEKILIAAALTVSSAAFAQTKAPEPDYTLAFNVGAVTEYRYRGISQSRLKPAAQGGIDFSHKSGFYVGTWASTIKWIKDAGGDANAEVDLYGGYKGTVGDFGYDAGVLRYFYPGSSLGVNPDTTELYAAGTWGPATLKYSHSTTNLFGFANSKGSGYLDASATFDLGNGFSVTPHVGRTWVRHNSAFSYTDYSVTGAKDFGNGLSVSLALIATDADKSLYVTPAGKFTGKTMLVAGVKYTF